ncbi:estradiol 17-beta-dehydrogenase 1-like [Ptychodera flava]|uniref:estradiol 17-beta-dehydrogenase 1-like n=1 Tax=Ptychodera flava TaxID=63121 RepID=UPI00396A249B
MAVRVVVITGCSSGIGLATAARLAKDDSKKYKVYATMRDTSRKEQLVKTVGDALGKTLFIRELDVTRDESVEAFFSELYDEEGRVDVLVNNAGISFSYPLEGVSLDVHRQIMETNFFGALRTIHKVVPDMKKRRSGRIVNITSVGGVIAFPFTDSYCASKFALEGLSESLVAVLKQFDVHISTLPLGLIKTPMAESKGSNLEKNEDLVDEESLKLMQRAIASKQWQTVFVDNIQAVEQTAEVIVSVIEDPNPKLRYTNSEGTREVLSIKLNDVNGESTVAHQMKYFDT